MIGDFVEESPAQRIVFGWGRLAELDGELERLGARRILVLSERSTKPLLKRVSGLVTAGSIVDVMAEVNPHVPREDVDDVRERVARADVDVVLTIGGGSATGLGKAVVLETDAQLIAVPTTYAGSEVTRVYGITENGRKMTGVNERVLPRTVIYDPELTTTLPPSPTASTGMNAIAHCVEALYSEKASPTTDALAQEGLEILPGALSASVSDPNDKAGRSAALYGSYLGGLAMATTKMAIHHRICQVLGGAFHLPHGETNAAVLPHAVAFNRPAAPSAVARVGRYLGASDPSAALYDLAESLGTANSLRSLGMRAEEIPLGADLVMDGDFYNPRKPTRADVVKIIKAAYQGRRPG
jgi:maleylacetate reductase